MAAIIDLTGSTPPPPPLLVNTGATTPSPNINNVNMHKRKVIDLTLSTPSPTSHSVPHPHAHKLHRPGTPLHPPSPASLLTTYNLNNLQTLISHHPDIISQTPATQSLFAIKATGKENLSNHQHNPANSAQYTSPLPSSLTTTFFKPESMHTAQDIAVLLGDMVLAHNINFLPYMSAGESKRAVEAFARGRVKPRFGGEQEVRRRRDEERRLRESNGGRHGGHLELPVPRPRGKRNRGSRKGRKENINIVISSTPSSGAPPHSNGGREDEEEERSEISSSRTPESNHTPPTPTTLAPPGAGVTGAEQDKIHHSFQDHTAISVSTTPDDEDEMHAFAQAVTAARTFAVPSIPTPPVNNNNRLLPPPGLSAPPYSSRSKSNTRNNYRQRSPLHFSSNQPQQPQSQIPERHPGEQPLIDLDWYPAFTYYIKIRGEYFAAHPEVRACSYADGFVENEWDLEDMGEWIDWEEWEDQIEEIRWRIDEGDFSGVEGGEEGIRRWLEGMVEKRSCI